jgi:hypothetical protein
MTKPNDTPAETAIMVGFNSIVGVRDSQGEADVSKKWRLAPDPFTGHGSDGTTKLCTLANMLVTAYRGQIPSPLYVVMDFDYTTYGWNMPYSTFWELQVKTAQGVPLQTFRFDVPDAHLACPARTVHFNHTYQASSDYFGVLEKVLINYTPPGPIYRCWQG